MITIQKLGIQQSEIQNKNSAIQNYKPEIQNPHSEISNQKSEIRNPKSTGFNPHSAFRNLQSVVLDFLLPRFCPSCNKKLSVNEKVICDTCLASIQITAEERIAHEYRRKFAAERIITEFFPLFVFEKDKALQHLIHSFKYEKRFQNALYFGEILGTALREKLLLWKIDYIIPIPLHHVKKAERGYNQSYYIAKGINRHTSIKVLDNIIKRKRFTESQTSMTLAERKQNISSAFVIRKNKKLTGKNILIVDDVITTGATVAECGRILLENGTGKVYAASVAIAD